MAAESMMQSPATRKSTFKHRPAFPPIGSIPDVEGAPSWEHLVKVGDLLAATFGCCKKLDRRLSAAGCLACF
eukprot:scaffold2252_cov255-Pinguiococcus_pyrenoidosus.AAC.4